MGESPEDHNCYAITVGVSAHLPHEHVRGHSLLTEMAPELADKAGVRYLGTYHDNPNAPLHWDIRGGEATDITVVVSGPRAAVRRMSRLVALMCRSAFERTTRKEDPLTEEYVDREPWLVADSGRLRDLVEVTVTAPCPWDTAALLGRMDGHDYSLATTLDETLNQVARSRGAIGLQSSVITHDGIIATYLAPRRAAERMRRATAEALLRVQQRRTGTASPDMHDTLDQVSITAIGPALRDGLPAPTNDPLMSPAEVARVLTDRFQAEVPADRVRGWIRDGRSPAGPLRANAYVGGAACLSASTVDRLATALSERGWVPGQRGRPPRRR